MRCNLHIRLVLDALPSFALRPDHGCADQTLCAASGKGRSHRRAAIHENRLSQAEEAIRRRVRPPGRVGAASEMRSPVGRDSGDEPGMSASVVRFSWGVR
jgi:hypothetical protein